jgi:hypothetical protein
MTGRDDDKRRDSEAQGLSRRDFVKAGAAVGVGAAALSGAGKAAAQEATTTENGTEWHYEADVVIAGGGCAGLAAAIRARDLGNEVLVVDQNFDLGGRMLHSGAFVSLGGGDPIQMRDMAGESDPEGFITVPVIHTPEEIDDNVDLLFTDMTDWSIVDAAGQNPFRYNERDLNRAWSENCPPTRQFLMDNYVRFSRMQGTHGGGGLSRSRGSYAFLMLGDETNIPAGTVSLEDAGHVDELRTSHFAPIKMTLETQRVGENAYANGAALSRCLEYSAREKGIQFMLFRHLDEIVREQPFAGRVIGIKASYSPRNHPETGELMQSLWSNGNVEETRDVVHIRARKAVVVATGGHAGNPQFRSMFYPAMREPAYVTSGYALQGPNGQNASGIIAGLRVGANLAGMQQNLSYPTTFHIPTRIGTRDAYTSEFPGHPTFGFRGSVGINIGSAGFEDLIAVNQVGKRFYNELRVTHRVDSARFPGGPRPACRTPASTTCRSTGATAGRNGCGRCTTSAPDATPPWRSTRARPAPTTFPACSGRSSTRARSTAPAGRSPSPSSRRPTATSSPPTRSRSSPRRSRRATSSSACRSPICRDGRQVERVRGRRLRPRLRARQRRADAQDRGPRFYAASLMLIWHDSYGGLRINGKAQVVDMAGEPIPGLYSGGEAAGGVNKHGLGRGLVQGYMVGTNAAAEQA